MSKSQHMPKVVAIAALFIASAPHYFFASPLNLKAAGDMNGFYGISIWPAAVLAGVAFMYDLDFSKRARSPWTTQLNTKTSLAILGLLGFILFYSYLFVGHYPLVTKTRPSFLPYALLLFACLRGLEAIFTHGVLQADILSEKNRLSRITLTLVSLGIIYGGLFIQYNEEATWIYVGALLAEGLFGALLFEAGLPLFAVFITRALCGAIFIWFTQMFLF